MKVNGKVVWITGASSGIGEALAYEMSKKGATLILTARNEKKLEEVKSNCSNDKVAVLPYDVSLHDLAPVIVKKAQALFGRIDIFVLNAGISQRATSIETTFEVEKRIMDVNFFGGIAMTKGILPIMLEQKSGQLVIMSSVLGKFSTPKRSTYAASKHALQGYYDAVRSELNPKEITVTIICPGYVNTNVTLNALTGDGKSNNKLTTASSNGYSPKDFAVKALKVIERGKAEAVIAKKEGMAIFLKRFFPSILRKVMQKIDIE